MSTVQESPHPNIIFKGIDGNECEEFVTALEDLAYAEGWVEDRRRMMFFARTRLRNAALRWFARLDPSVKNDWDLFVQALFDQYPPVANLPNSNEVGVATPIWSATTFSPTLSTATLPANPRLPSAEEDEQQEQAEQARSGSGHLSNEMPLESSHIVTVSSLRSYDSSRLGPHIGRLRVVYEQESFPSAYVWGGKVESNLLLNGGFPFPHEASAKCITLDRQDALLVSFITDAEPHTITCPGTSQDQRDLAVVLTTEYESHPLGTTVGVRTACAITFGNYSYGVNCRSQAVSKIWNVLADGTLQGTLSDYPEPMPDWQGRRYGAVQPSSWTTTTVYVDIAGVPISFAKDYATPTSLHPISGHPFLKARIVFEPL